MEMQPGTTNWSQRDGYLNLVTFRLARQVYALPIEPIQSIIEMVTIHPMPQVTPIVEGVINFHGAAVPVVNMRRHLGLPEKPLQLHTPIILVHHTRQLVGLIVDEVLDVLTRSRRQVVHPRSVLPEGLGEAKLLCGLIQTQEGMVLVLDIEHLFEVQQARALSDAVEALPEDILEQVAADLSAQRSAPVPAAPVPAAPVPVEVGAVSKPERKSKRSQSKQSAVKAVETKASA